MWLGQNTLIGLALLAYLLYYGLIPFYSIGMLGLLFVGLVALIVVNQESILYIPKAMGYDTPAMSPPGYRSPAEHQLAFEDVRVETKDGVKITGWFIPAPGGKSRATLLFCHENAGHIGLRMPEFLNNARVLNVNQLVFDYRGYGESEGTPSEEGLIEDTMTMLRWLETKASSSDHVDLSKVILAGRSLGGAVAIHVAALLAEGHEWQPAAYIFENTFTSILDIAGSRFAFLVPFLQIPFFRDNFLRLHWRSIDRIPRIRRPILMLSSLNDEIVPAEHMKQLRAAVAPGVTCEFHTFPTMHNDISANGGPEYWTKKLGFIESIIEKQS